MPERHSQSYIHCWKARQHQGCEKARSPPRSHMPALRMQAATTAGSQQLQVVYEQQNCKIKPKDSSWAKISEGVVLFWPLCQLLSHLHCRCSLFSSSKIKTFPFPWFRKRMVCFYSNEKGTSHWMISSLSFLFSPKVTAALWMLLQEPVLQADLTVC